MNKPYVILEHKHNGMQAIKLTAEPFEGIIYSYGKISFNADEEERALHLKFEYDVLDWNNKGLTNPKPFEQYIGKLLEEMIHEGIQENNLTYTGGTDIDANRTKDSEQSDI
jgi:hypothetical protein